MSRLLEINIIELLENGSLCRRDIADMLGTPWTTTYDHLERLENKDVVERYRQKDNDKRGASKVYWRLKTHEATIYELENELNRLKGDPIEELEYQLGRLKIKFKEGVGVKSV